MQSHHQPAGTPIIITLPGPAIHHRSMDSFRDLVETQLNRGESRLALDFSDIRFIDSSALSLLISIGRRATNLGGGVKFCALQPAVREVLDITRLTRLFDVHGTLESALDSFAR